MISFAEDTNKKNLINNDTINRCQKISKKCIMGNGIITTIRQTTIDKWQIKSINEERDVTIWVILITSVSSEEIRDHQKLHVGNGIFINKRTSYDKRNFELYHLQLLI